VQRLPRLELRVERLALTFRLTYAFHARELRFECNSGAGFGRVFPETFSFHVERHDPAEIFLQLDDLAREPRLLAPNARPRDAQLLVNRMLIALPRYLESVLDRIERESGDARELLARSCGDLAILCQVALRFLATRSLEEAPGLRIAMLHLRKLLARCLRALVVLLVEPAYLADYVAGRADPVNPADDLSEAGFFHILAGSDAAARNRAIRRLAQRAYFRWLEDVCLDEDNSAFEVEDSPFESREIEVRRAVHARGELEIRRASDLAPFLRRSGRDCQRVLFRLEGWFLRQYDVTHAAAIIHHAARLAHGRTDPERALSLHGSRSYGLALLALAFPFLAAAFGYARAPMLFDVLASLELLAIYGGVLWFLLYRFCVRKDLTFFRAGVPRIGAGIIVGYLPIFFIDEVWDLARQPWLLIGSISLLLAFTTLLYIYIEVQRRLADPRVAFARARQIFLLGHLQSLGFGILLTGLVGGFMVHRNWEAQSGAQTFAGQLPEVIGIAPFELYPSAIFLMSFMAFFIGTFLQLMWEDLPITEPL
jgi:hypothetical protein